MTAMRLTTLASGLRVAIDPMPGLQTAAVGLSPTSDRAPSRRR